MFGPIASISNAALSVVMPQLIRGYGLWIVAGLIVVLGFVFFGREELRRFSITRIWAISSVCFAESIRRKVLWVVPLAIAGVIAVSTLQHAADPQESLRQIIKFSLFAAGLMVTVTAIILACTNLPREIENRVIFTIVTKPTTRLEIVLGKVVGFIRISGVIVLIMGVFTFAYVGYQNRKLTAQLTERLAQETDESTRETLKGYLTAGLLSTKSLENTADLQVMEHDPVANGPQWLSGNYGYTFAVPFELTAADRSLLDAAATDPNHYQVLIINTMPLKRNKPTPKDMEYIMSRRLPLEKQTMGPALPGQDTTPIPIPQLTVRILDSDLNIRIPEAQLNGGKMATALSGVPLDSTAKYILTTGIGAGDVRTLSAMDKFWIQVVPETSSVSYGVESEPTVIDVIDSTGKENVIHPKRDASDPSGYAMPRFISAANRFGMKIVGATGGTGSVAIFRFTNTPVPADLSRNVAFRFRAGVERSGDMDSSKPWSVVTLTVINRATHESSGPIEFHPETNQDFPVPVPGKFVAGGNFDVRIRGMDDGQYIGLNTSSVQLISAEHNFATNLTASLLVLWLLSILVVVIAIFTSTFLSWPIAIVLTLLLLLGHWGVEQLGDTLNPGVGRTVAADWGISDKVQTQMVSRSVDALAQALSTISTVLPDLSKFPVMENITRGVAMPPSQVAGALGVLACYGVPMLVISFIVLKNKEVAP